MCQAYVKIILFGNGIVRYCLNDKLIRFLFSLLFSETKKNY